MKNIKFLGFDCVSIGNKTLHLLVTKSVGPRIISLSFMESENLFAELTDVISRRPDGREFHFYGGHRFWYAPESMPRTYYVDDKPVEIHAIENEIIVTQPVEEQTGMQKTLKIHLEGDDPQVTIHHELTNFSQVSVEYTPWAITQMKPDGIAILPLSQEQSGFLPNRTFTLWPYSDITNKQVIWGNRYILINAQLKSPFKIGFRNPRGWLAYWFNGILFVKKAEYHAQSPYYDFGSSSECYCNDRFLELETLAPIKMIDPGQTVSHTETWHIYANIDVPANEIETESIVSKLGLG
ncbi:MAG: hypothetical protein JW908_00370 [Anaerolineales bacterium]|nr:hypothetical protein [Anaerolineales bacterium]